MKHLIFACLPLLLPMVSGQDRPPVYVPPGTDQIQKQIDAAKEGDVLILGNGNKYFESKTLLINKGLTIKGEGTTSFRSNDVTVYINDTSIVPDYPNTLVFVNSTWNVMLRDFTLLHTPSNKSCIFQEPFVSPQPSTRMIFVTPDVLKKKSSLPPAPLAPPPGSLPASSGGTSPPGATTAPSSPGATTAPASPGTTKARRQAPTPSTLAATTDNAATTTTDLAETDMETRPAFGSPETSIAAGPGGPSETAPARPPGGTSAPPGGTSAPGAGPTSAPGGTSAPGASAPPGAPAGGGEGSGPVVLPPPGPSGFNNLTGGPYLVIRGSFGPWYSQRRLVDAKVGNCSLSNKQLSAPQMFIIMAPTYCVGHMGFAIEYEKANTCMDVVNGTGGVTQFSHNVTVNMTDTLRAYNASVDHLGDKVKQEERVQSNATTVFFEGAVNPADRTRSIVDVYWKVPGARAVLIALKKKPITPQSASLAINVTIPSPYTLMPTPSTFNATLLTLPSGNSKITTGPVMLNNTGVECTGNGSCWFVVMFDVMGCQITGQYRFTLTPACRPSAAGCKPPPAFGAILSLGSSPFCGAPISAQSSADTLIRSDSTYTLARTDNKFTFGNTAYFLVILDTLNPDFIIQNARLVAINRTNMEDTCAGVTWDLSQNTTSINQTFNADMYPPTLTFGVKMDKNATCAVAGKTQVTVNFTFVIEVTYEDGIYTGLPPLPGLVPGGMSTQPATEPIPATTNQNGPTDAGSQSTAPAAPTGTGAATTSGAPARRRREITLGNIYANSATEVTYSDGDLKSLDDLVNGLLDSMGLGNDTNTTTGSSSGADSATSTSDTASSAASSAGGETSSGSAAPTSSDAAGNGTAEKGSNSTGSAKNGTGDGKKPSAPPAGGTAAANASTGPVDLMVPATWGDLEWKIVYATSALLAVACVWCCCTNCIACIWNSQTKHTKKKNKVVRKHQHPSQVAFMAQSSDEAALLAHRQSMGQVPQYGGNSQYY